MIYRRFGKTGLDLPVLSCGGMRFQHQWQDMPLDQVPEENQANLKAMKAGARPEALEKLRAAVRRAEAAVKRWEYELGRIKELDASGAAAEVEMERTIEAKEKAESDLRVRPKTLFGHAALLQQMMALAN